MEIPYHWVMPAGILGLVDLIKRYGFEIIGLNYPMELSINEKFSIRNWLKAEYADFYLVGIHWFVHSRGARDLIKLIKEIHPKSIIIVGGMTAGLFPRQFLDLIPEIDYIISGDAEEPLIRLLQALREGRTVEDVPNLYYRLEGKPFNNKSRFVLKDFGTISYGDIEFLHFAEHYPRYSYPRALLDERSLWLVNGRGCIYECPTCGGARKISRDIFGRNGLLRRSVDSVIADIKKLLSLDLDFIKLTHDISAFGKKYYEKFLGIYAKQGWEMGIYNEFWQLPQFKFLQTITQQGLATKFHLAVTVHSGDEKIRKKYGKYFSNKELLDMVEFCLKEKMTLTLFFSRYLFDDNENTLKSTLQLIHKIKNGSRHNNLLRFCYEPIVVDPCSKLTSHKSEDEIFYTYFNWNSLPVDIFYGRSLENITMKEHLLDRKIFEMVNSC